MKKSNVAWAQWGGPDTPSAEPLEALAPGKLLDRTGLSPPCFSPPSTSPTSPSLLPKPCWWSVFNLHRSISTEAPPPERSWPTGRCYEVARSLWLMGHRTDLSFDSAWAELKEKRARWCDFTPSGRWNNPGWRRVLVDQGDSRGRW